MKHGSDRYNKRYSSWTQLVTMLFGILSRCDSMGEACCGMQALVITNNFDITAEEVAFLYKKRWTVGLLSPKMKGNHFNNGFSPKKRDFGRILKLRGVFR